MSARPRPAPRPSRRGAVPVTVLSGLDRLVVDDLATGLLLRSDRFAAVHADLAGVEDGRVAIHVHSGTGESWTAHHPLEHRCVSCTLRTALVTELTALATADHDALIVQLHPGVDPLPVLRGVAADLPPSARIDTHVGVLDPDWLDLLGSGAVLSDRDPASGQGTVIGDQFAASLLAAGIESATTLVIAGVRPRTNDAADDDRAVLDLLAPAAVRLRMRRVLDAPVDDLLATGRFDATRLHPLATYGLRDPGRALDASSLSLVRWTAGRPLHPLRLHDALDRVSPGVIRSSGRLDVADQAGSVVAWDSAGEALALGPVGPWNRPLPLRRSSLAFLGHDLDAGALRSILDGCLLDDSELAIVTSAWQDVTEICPGLPERDTRAP